MTAPKNSSPPTPRPAAPVLDFAKRSAARRSHPPVVHGTSAGQAPIAPSALSQPPRPGKTTTPGTHLLHSPSKRKKLDSAPSSGFAAKIDGATMADLVQLECLRGLTRAVKVSSGSEEGELYFDQGQLVHAESGTESGQAAALHILSWEEGTVEPSDRLWLDAPTIEIGWQGLLMLAAQMRDESRTSNLPEAGNSQGARCESGSKWKETEPLKLSADKAEEGIFRRVRLDSEGVVLDSYGEVGDFPDAAAYTVRLAQLIGDGLGLEDFRGMECSAADKVMITYIEEDEIVALEGKSGRALDEHRKKAGV